MSVEAALDAFAAALLDDDAVELYDRAPCGYLSTTPDGLIIKANQTFLTLTGYRREDLVGQRTFVDLLTVGGQIYHETHYAPLLRMHDRVQAIAFDLVRADGDRLPVLVNAVLDRRVTGEPRIIRVAVFDATDRREYERELLHAKRRAEASEARARELAQTLQQTLIPPAPPQVPGLDVAVAYRAAGTGDEVGGDFYDVFEAGLEDWVVVIGDVRGKGAGAAVVTALARYTLRGVTVHVAAPSQALAALNRELLRQHDGRFCTVTLLRMQRTDQDGWTLRIACGGHPLPILFRDTEAPVAVGEPGTLIGVLDDPEFVDVPLTLHPGDTLLLYTDGVTEGRRGQEFYDEPRLRAVAGQSSTSAGDMVAAVLEDVLLFQGGNPRDDIALLAIRVPHRPEPQPPKP
jgi:sigma-B regulation protein RsbU (phosphoserine phosphatase)